MNILKVFGISVGITPLLIIILSVMVNSWMPISSIIALTFMFAIPNFVMFTLIKGLYKVLKVVWR